ncbi:unnamed protein product [Brugia timori]|uniref:Uncharacterized protein n=1 Tax=Brugia timori TaxID=42155 RepID=A0A0R3QI42_9BILA|nr:unnamed protein product [Brugia timori]
METYLHIPLIYHQLSFFSTMEISSCSISMLAVLLLSRNGLFSRKLNV